MAYYLGVVATAALKVPEDKFAIRLEYEDEAYTFVPAEFAILSPQQYDAVLSQVLDPSQKISSVPTPGFLVGEMENQIKIRHGRLPRNWDSISSDLLDSYALPFRALIGDSPFFRKSRGR